MNFLDWYAYGARFYDPSLGRWHVQDPLSESEPNLSPYNYVADNPVNFFDPYGLYRAINPRESGGGGNPSSDWPFQGDDLEPPFGFGRNNFGRYGPGNFPDPGPGFGDLYVQGVDGKYYRWSDIAKNITIYTGSSYYLGGILDAALSGGIAGIEAFVEDYWRRFYDLLANSSSLGEYGSGYGMMFDGDPKKQKSKENYPGAIIIESSILPFGSAVTLPPFIIVHPAANDLGTRRHEYGHILQYTGLRILTGSQITGYITYLYGIGIPSLWSANKARYDPYWIHQEFFIEKSANQLSYWYFGKPSNWNADIYPIFWP